MTLSDVLALETERRIRLSPTYVQTFRKRDQANPRNVWSAPVMPGDVEPGAYWHGTDYGYQHKRCRCDGCRRAHNAINNTYKRATKASMRDGQAALRRYVSSERKHNPQPSLFQDAGA